MTAIRVFFGAGQIIRIESEGHSGYASEGEDIVCAAVTSAFRLTECILSDSFELSLRVEMDPDRAFLALEMPTGLRESEQAVCHAVFHGLATTLRAYADEYPRYIQVMEVKASC